MFICILTVSYLKEKFRSPEEAEWERVERGRGDKADWIGLELRREKRTRADIRVIGSKKSEKIILDRIGLNHIRPE